MGLMPWTAKALAFGLERFPQVGIIRGNMPWLCKSGTEDINEANCAAPNAGDVAPAVA